MQILISGSLAYDRIMDFPGKFIDHILPEKIHILNVSFTVNGLKEQFGGTAGNIAYNLALLNEKPVILAAAGKDFEGYAKWLSKLGLSLDGIRNIADEFTAGAYITTDQSDNQITGFNPGAMKYPSNYSFNKITSEDTIAIVAPGNIEDMLTYVKYYKKNKISYIFDPGQSIPSLSSHDINEMIKGCDIFISNDYEHEMILEKTKMRHEDLLDHCNAIITTLGENGSMVYTKHSTLKIDPAHVKGVVDPTGAGDAYRAGLIKGIVSGKDLHDAARMGSTCGSYAVQFYGTQEHSFTLERFWERYKDNYESKEK